MSLREFLGYELTQETPDHSTLSRWRRNLPETLHREVFEWVVLTAHEEGVLKGRKVAIDSTTMEANAAMKSIVRKADGVTYQAYLKKLAKAEGIENPTPQHLQRMDRKRRGKKASNKEWKSKTDSHARMARLKGGRTRMAYKVENVMDIQSRITVAAHVHLADQADPATIGKTVLSTDETVMNAGIEGGIEDVILDRAYHADAVLEKLDETGYRAYIAEPKRGRRNWTKQSKRDGDERVARRKRVFYGNRRRSRSRRGRHLQRDYEPSTRRGASLNSKENRRPRPGLRERTTRGHEEGPVVCRRCEPERHSACAARDRNASEPAEPAPGGSRGRSCALPFPDRSTRVLFAPSGPYRRIGDRQDDVRAVSSQVSGHDPSVRPRG